MNGDLWAHAVGLYLLIGALLYMAGLAHPLMREYVGELWRGPRGWAVVVGIVLGICFWPLVLLLMKTGHLGYTVEPRDESAEAAKRKLGELRSRLNDPPPDRAWCGTVAPPPDAGPVYAAGYEEGIPVYPEAPMAARPEMYEGNDGKWYWRMTQSQNGQVTSDGGQGFTTEGGCIEAYQTNRRLIIEGPDKPIKVEKR